MIVHFEHDPAIVQCHVSGAAVHADAYVVSGEQHQRNNRNSTAIPDVNLVGFYFFLVNQVGTLEVAHVEQNRTRVKEHLFVFRPKPVIFGGRHFGHRAGCARHERFFRAENFGDVGEQCRAENGKKYSGVIAVFIELRKKCLFEITTIVNF